MHVSVRLIVKSCGRQIVHAAATFDAADWSILDHDAQHCELVDLSRDCADYAWRRMFYESGVVG
jgi:hypothetical protein